MMKYFWTAVFAVAAMTDAFCGEAGKEPVFERVFAWASVSDEESAKTYAEIGVTDIAAQGEQGALAAKKYDMRPYCSYYPGGPHSQVLSAAEKAHYDYINGVDLRGTVPKEETGAKINARLIEKKCQFGGEPVASPDLCPENIACFLSDEGHVKAKERLAATLEKNPLAEGITFDYIGYTNFKSCECDDCRKRLAAYLKEEGLEDTQENRNTFFRDALMHYINTLVDYVHELRPGMKVAIHLYPVFLPDPLYGRLLKADYIEETVAWYFQWDDAKISDYTRKIISAPHLDGCKSVPFVGLNAAEGKPLAHKSPERLEQELKLILAAGGRDIAVCNGPDMIKPGYAEVFKRHTRGGLKGKD